jgi:electron transfer flavoprotein-quinone oxidoreductase
MDFAMHSGILAAETVLEAVGKGDFSADTLAAYRRSLDESYVMQDLRNFQDAVKFLHSRDMFTTVPDILCEFGRNYFTVGGGPSKKAASMLLESARNHSSIWNLLNLGRKAAQSL